MIFLILSLLGIIVCICLAFKIFLAEIFAENECFLKTKTFVHLLEKRKKEHVFNLLKNLPKEDVKKLNPFAVQSRYPDDRFYIDRDEAEAAVKRAKRIFGFVKDKIENPDKNMNIFKS